MPLTSDNFVDTRRRLVDAAGPIFAEHGYRAATVKDICDAAEANIAAINYHFGGKQRLYAEVLREAHRRSVSIQQLAASAPSGASGETTPEEKLRAFLGAVLRGVLGAQASGWRMRLIVREMLEPTEALDELVEMEIRPKSRVLRGVVAEFLGCEIENDRTAWFAASVMAQVMFFIQGQPVIGRLFPHIYAGDDPIDAIVEHIVRFSAAGLRGNAQKPPRSRKGTR